MTDENIPDLEPLPLEDDDEETELEPYVIDEPVPLAEAPGTSKPVKSKIQAFGAGATKHKSVGDLDFKRPLNLTGGGATRCRMFHAKLSPGPLDYLQKQINEWLDENDFEVKNVTQSVGVLEGKHTEPNLFVIVWY